MIFGIDLLSNCYELSLSSVEAKELSSVAVSQKCTTTMTKASYAMKG